MVKARYWYSHFQMGTQARICAATWIGITMLCQPAGAAAVEWSQILDQPAAWYASLEARAVADTVLRYQRTSGGWPKDIDMTAPPRGAQANPAAADATIDNGATVTQMRLLDRVSAASTRPAYRDAALRGIEYLLAAQYPNGGGRSSGRASMRSGRTVQSIPGATAWCATTSRR